MGWDKMGWANLASTPHRQQKKNSHSYKTKHHAVGVVTSRRHNQHDIYVCMYLALSGDGPDGNHREAGHARDGANDPEYRHEGRHGIHDRSLLAILGHFPEPVQRAGEVHDKQWHRAASSATIIIIVVVQYSTVQNNSECEGNTIIIIYSILYGINSTQRYTLWSVHFDGGVECARDLRAPCSSRTIYRIHEIDHEL